MPQKIDVWIEEDRDKHRLRYRDARGEKQNGGSYDSRPEAKIAKDNLIVRLKLTRLGECDPTLPLPVAFDKYQKDLPTGLANKKGKKIKASSIATIVSHIQPLLERAKVLGDLEDEEMLKEWYTEMSEDGLSSWTIYGIIKDCAAFCHYMQRQKMLFFDPFASIPKERPESRPRYYTDEELDALEAAAIGKEIHLWLRMGYQAGLRYSEVLNANWENIRLLQDGTGEFTIWSYQSKNRKTRTIPLSTEIVELLGSKRAGPLFPGWTRGIFRYHWAKLKCDAGIVEPSVRYLNKYAWAKKEVNEDEGARFHDLRHTFCKLFLQNGGSIPELHKITGHRSVQVLIDTYSHFETKHLSTRIEGIVTRPKFAGQWRGKTDIIDINSVKTGSQPVMPTESDKTYKAGEN